jgi:hypothetical protein
MIRRRFLALAACATAARGATTADAPLVSFGLLTDVQYADADPQGDRHYRESLPKLKAAARDLAGENLPFSLHLGDVIDRGFSSFGTVLPLFAGLGHPVRHLTGNHDYSVADREKAGVPAVLGMPADYYLFRSHGVRFVMLDTNDVSLHKHPQGGAGQLAAAAMMERLAGAEHAVPWNGGVSPAQLDWLDGELAAADAAGEPAIICSHHPLLPETGHQAWNNRAVLDVIGRHQSPRACFSGHNHAGAETISNGVPFITFKSLLHQPQVTAYAVVRLFRERLVIEGRGRETPREIALRTT